MPLHTFIAGESAQVAENLDANFVYLESLILALSGAQSRGTSNGTSVVNGFMTARANMVGTATGVAFVTGITSPVAQTSGVGTASGSSTAAAISAANSRAAGTAAGLASVFSFSSTPSAGTAAGSATATAVGSSQNRAAGTATASATGTGVPNTQSTAVGTATGSSTVTAVGSGSATESPSGTTVATTAGTIVASSQPGTTSPNLNAFTINSSAQVLVNNVVDSTRSNVVELYYNNHVLYLQTNSDAWFTWQSAGVWSPVASPFPPVVHESVEGFAVTAAGVLMYASSTPGTPASANATVGNGLSTYELTANPGFIKINGITQDGTFGSTTTSNVVKIYYHGSTAYQLNSQGFWFQYTGANFWPQVASPIPATPAIQIAAVQNQNVNTTFVVSGAYQNYVGTIPTLQYSDNGGSSWNSFPSTAGVSNDQWKFVHPPVTTVQNNLTVSVRDANSTGTVKTSNTYSVFTPGVVTLLSGSLSNNTIAAGQPSGTVVGTFTINTAPQNAFTGTFLLTGTNAGNFTVNASRQLVTTAVLAAGSRSISVAAVMAGAAGSPLDLGAFTIIVSTESLNGTSVTTVGPTIVGSATPGSAGSTLTWALTGSSQTSVFITPTSGGSVTDSGGTVYTMTNAGDGTGAINANGTLINGSQGTRQITMVTGVLWAQDNATGTWYTYSGGTAGTFTPQTGSPPAASGFAVTLNGVNNAATTNGTTQLYYINHRLYKLTGTGAWSFYNGTGVTGNVLTNGSWTSSATPIPTITLDTQSFPAGVIAGTTICTPSLVSAGTALTGVVWALSGTNASTFTMPDTSTGVLKAAGTIPAGSYTITLTATV